MKKNLRAILFFVFLSFSFVSGAEFVTQETQRVVVHAEVVPGLIQSPSVNETEELLKQFRERLNKSLAPVFQKSPIQETATVYLYNDRDSFVVSLASHGIDPKRLSTSHPGGFFDLATGKISTFRQPTEYYTRHVLLHEFVHWYVYQLLKGKTESLPLWFQEGLADHFAMHVWDGQVLQIATIPQVMLEDYPARALEAVRKIKTGQTIEHSLDRYALYWAMTRHLLTRQPEKLSEMIQRGFPDEEPVDWNALESGLETEQIPWLWVWNSWEQVGPGAYSEPVERNDANSVATNGSGKTPDQFANGFNILGASFTSGMMIRKETPDFLNVRITPQSHPWTMGLVFNFENADRFDAIQFQEPAGSFSRIFWRHIRRTDTGWQVLQDWQFLGESGKSFFLEATIVSDELRIIWDKIPIPGLSLLPKTRIGLSVHESVVLFHVE